LIIPYLISPLGVILCTWFFRGARDEREAIEAQGIKLRPGAFPRRTLGIFIRFSLPVFALYLLFFLNMTLLPFVMIAKPESYTMPLFLIRLMRFEPGPRDLGYRAALGQLSLLQYLVPLALLVVSIIIVLPALAVVVRKKWEEAPAVDAALIEKLKADQKTDA
jgi:hypothetical protein